MIAVQNIFYMLSYAFRVLNEDGYKDVATEEFENTAELCAAVLEKGLTIQVKRGLSHEYVSHTEAFSGVRGKLELNESIKGRTLLNQRLVCTYDDFTSDSYVNQIVKATVYLLLRSDITKERKKSLKRLMMYFADVSNIDVRDIDWHLRFTKNNQSYRMLIAVCYLVVKGLLQTTSKGEVKLMDFLDDQKMHRLYEKFILEYYRKEFPQIKVSASQIPWQLDDDESDFLPIMQSDIMLTQGNKTLIIDAKYYKRAMRKRLDESKQKFISGHLYQIFTYVKNEQLVVGSDHLVSGMLLYARTDEELAPAKDYSMSGNVVSVRSLDLNQDFSDIRRELNAIAERAFA